MCESSDDGDAAAVVGETAVVGEYEESAGFDERILGWWRAENRAAARQLVAIGDLFAHRLSGSSETQDWAVDTEAAVAAEIAATLRIGQAVAAARIRYARAMVERLPEVAEVFLSGAIDLRMLQTIVYRTDLITDAEILAEVDWAIATRVHRWVSLSNARLSGLLDKLVADVDADAVRQRKRCHTDRQVWISPDNQGISQIEGTLATPDARALDARLSALADTVCADDPRTREQRRADALGALAAGADRLGCRCGGADCAAGARKPASPVTIHVIAEGPVGSGPGWQIGADGLITAEFLEELALSAKLVPLIHPGYRPPEPGYHPSTALADFVRARDLTCRWPGCDVPAVHTDIDHTIPHAQGGPTHAGNLKCYCRTHHLVKTFWGWTEQQLPDGTLILTSPAGQTQVTTPGSALLYPSLCTAVGGMPTPDTSPPATACTDRSAMMPRRRRTRDRDRATRIAAERAHNRDTRTPPSYTDAAADPAPF